MIKYKEFNSETEDHINEWISDKNIISMSISEYEYGGGDDLGYGKIVAFVYQDND